LESELCVNTDNIFAFPQVPNYFFSQYLAMVCDAIHFRDPS